MNGENVMLYMYVKLCPAILQPLSCLCLDAKPFWSLYDMYVLSKLTDIMIL